MERSHSYPSLVNILRSPIWGKGYNLRPSETHKSTLTLEIKSVRDSCNGHILASSCEFTADLIEIRLIENVRKLIFNILVGLNHWNDDSAIITPCICVLYRVAKKSKTNELTTTTTTQNVQLSATRVQKTGTERILRRYKPSKLVLLCISTVFSSHLRGQFQRNTCAVS